MGRLLTSFEYDVVVAASGTEGLASFRNLPTDLVIVDLYIPETDGLEIIAALMRGSPVPKIIAMSGHRSRELMLYSAQHLGAVAIIHKPFTAESLASVVRRAIN